ncbi:MAG: long-chain fatty acid--CoA ligase [Candidatus Thermoplasmatota archaeon]|nr:long-chain fatty acid--CoA ligase [Candidatus Thermoplasmatota archaeon]
MDRSLWQKSYPKGVPDDIEIPEESVPGMLRRTASKYPGTDAVIFALTPTVARRWTYRQLWKDIVAFSRGLAALGFKRRDRIALYFPNCPQYLVAYYGALRLGLTVVQVSPLYVGDDLVFPITDSGAKGVVTIDVLSHNLESVWPRLEKQGLKVVVSRFKDAAPFLVGALFLDGALRKKGLDPSPPTKFDFVPFKSLLRRNPTFAPVKIRPDRDVAVFQYTGGTTGKPKAAMLTHRNLVANALQLRAWDVDSKEGAERVLSVIPFFHVYGMTVAMNYPLFFGGTLIINPEKPSPETVIPLIDRYKPTQFPGVPALYNAINNHPHAKEIDMSSIRACLSGSAPLTVEITKKFEQLTHGRLIEGYGLSEASPVTHANPLKGDRKIGSIGFPVPNTDMRVVSLEDPKKDLGVEEAGELAVRGPQVMAGYWNQPDETQMVLKDGWLYTGDIAKVDKDGYTYIVDRKKDIILVGGFNVYPREVEEVLYTHPDILEAAVIGVPDDKLGEIVKAFVVAKPGTKPQEVDIIDFVRSHIAHFKAPRSVEFVDTLPKTLVGKVLRRELKKATDRASAKP